MTGAGPPLSQRPHYDEGAATRPAMDPAGGSGPNRRTTWLMAPDGLHGRAEPWTNCCEPTNGRRSGRERDRGARGRPERLGGATRQRTTFSTNPICPLLRLSTSTLAAIFVGGALGTVCPLPAGGAPPRGQGGVPWVTLLVNLSGSFAIGLLVPLTEHVSHRLPVLRPLLVIGFLGGWTTYSTLAVEATLLADHGDVATCLAYLTATVAGGLALVVAGHAVGRRLVATVNTSAPTLGLALLVALAGGAGAVLRALTRPPPRPAALRPAPRRHPGGQRVRFPDPRLLTGLSLYHGLGSPRARRRRSRAVRRVHHVVDGELGDDPPAALRAPLPAVALHAGRAGRLSGRGRRRHRPHGVGLGVLFHEANDSGGGQVHIRLRSP